MDDKLEMFVAYIRELRKIRNEPVWFVEICSMFREIQEAIKDGAWEWVDVEGVGFIVISKGADRHPGCDYYIIDAYIEPESRRKGLMKKAILEYARTHKGKYCLEIINNNIAARKFWKSIGKLHTIKDWHIADCKCTPYWIEIGG